MQFIIAYYKFIKGSYCAERQNWKTDQSSSTNLFFTVAETDQTKAQISIKFYHEQYIIIQSNQFYEIK